MTTFRIYDSPINGPMIVSITDEVGDETDWDPARFLDPAEYLTRDAAQDAMRSRLRPSVNDPQPYQVTRYDAEGEVTDEFCVSASKVDSNLKRLLRQGSAVAVEVVLLNGTSVEYRQAAPGTPTSPPRHNGATTT